MFPPGAQRECLRWQPAVGSARWLHTSKTQRLIQWRKRESFHPDGPMFRTPVVGAAPRVMQGLDMDKVVTMPYLPFSKTREKHTNDYKYGDRNLAPHANAMSPEELVTYFDNYNFYEKFTVPEMMRAMGIRYGRIYIWAASFLVLVAVPLGLYFIPSNRFEPIEYYMPVEEYYENYVWHDFGKFINRKAYLQYLEARRAKKWGRLPNVDPVDYIPPEYRSAKQKRARGELPPLPEGEEEPDVPY